MTTDDVRAARRAHQQRIANGPSALLRALESGESLLLARYTLTSQVASTVQRLGRLYGLRFVTAAETGGIRVTRVASVNPCADLL